MSARLAVVGAAGSQANAMLEALQRGLDGSRIIAIDRRWPAGAEARLAEAGIKTLTADVLSERDRVLAEIGEVQLLANFAGPYYVIGTRILDLALEAGADYLDICDDVDATQALLDRHDAAVAAGSAALIGMGSSPGTVNILVRAAVDSLGAQSEDVSVDLRWTVDAHDLTPPALDHLIHCVMTAYIDNPATPDWDALEPEAVAFPEPVGERLVVAVGHPELLTIPRYLSQARVTNKGGVSPDDYLHVLWALAKVADRGGITDEVRAALADYHRLRLPGHERVGSGLRIDVTVAGSGLRFSSGARTEMSDATGLPAAAGILVMLDDAPLAPGAWTPEHIEPGLFFQRLRIVSEGGGGLRLWRLENGRETKRESISQLLQLRRDG
jgi:hypothetical protein